MSKLLSKNSKRHTIIAASALGVVGLIGLTFAISRDRVSFDNNFKLAGYQTIFTETFDAPQNWKTCETVDKTITATNDVDSSGPVAIRIKLEEQWIASDGTTELPLVSAASGLTMAQINFTQNSGWTKDGNYYYYDTDLAKGATSSSLITGVTLNCNANLSITEPGSDGAYADGTYHLKITAQAIDADSKGEWDKDIASMIRKKANPDSNIDFTQAATIADGNGNGVNRYTENGQDVYYFRGEVNDNNVIWANKCWKIVRTTATGGTKMIYNGLPTTVDGAQQCNATGADSKISVNVDGTIKNIFKFNNNGYSPADVGYMYGIRREYRWFYPDSTVLIFSNDVSRNGNTYTLDTSAGQSISGTWADERLNAAVRYHYFCTDGAASCDNTKIGYIHYFGHSDSFDYLNLSGYDDIEDMKAAMFTNTNSSNAKTMIETWFERENLDGHIANTKNYEDDLEDTIFCNDRGYYSGSLKGKDSDATPTADSITEYSYHNAYSRNMIKNANNNFEPSFDCANANDAFTKDSANGNGKLNHKVGLITADELTMAGNSWGLPSYDTTSYLYSGQFQYFWSASPIVFNSSQANGAFWMSNLSYIGNGAEQGLRPLVSLKAGMEFASGTGSKTDPYIVE